MNNCETTYATLRVSRPGINISEVSSLLGFHPTDVFPKDKPAERWIYSTQALIKSDSLDIHLQHITKLLLRNGTRRMIGLQSTGHQTDIFCYWLSKNGHGGPEIQPETLLELGSLGLKLSLDVYQI